LAPLLVSDIHEKDLLSSDDYYDDEDYTCLENSNLILGPDDTDFEFKICFSEKSGNGFISITHVDKAKIVGNIVFKATSESLRVTTGEPSVQISSAMLNDEYRGIGLGVVGYEKLTSYFHIVSDDRQTVDGAALWKNNISKSPILEVQIIIDYDTSPRLLLNNNDQVEVYHPDKAELEKFIWSSNDMDTAKKARYLGIESDVGVHNKSRVLLAKSKNRTTTH
jgi:hypothetical protein